MTQERKFSDKFDDSVPLDHGLIMHRRDGKVMTNVPHLVTHHSPDGFNFGYGGSGPADLALNVCEWYLQHIGYKSAFDGDRAKCFIGTCWNLAWQLHQQFKRDFIADVPENGGKLIKFKVIRRWFNEKFIEMKEEQWIRN